MSVKPASSLANFLSTSKGKYLADIRATPSKGAEWTVVMGNEAGDLDSVASSIAYAWVQSEIQKKPCVPLIQIAQDDLNLRAENMYALKLAGVSNPQLQLLSITDLEGVKPFPSNTFALVDHNRLGNLFSVDNPNTRVIAVIDHHEDEHFYADSADPRKVAPAGSCASHVATLYPKEAEIPRELATLLLSAILIDTGGLVPGGKALQVDHEAASYLIPRSTLSDSISSSTISSISPTDPGMLSSITEVKRLSDDLSDKKVDVSHLGAWDLLRRDYKEYTYTLNWHPAAPTIKAGLATVPVKLRSWGSDGKLEKEAQRWMEHRRLSVLGVLTSFRDTSKFGKSGKGKHRREMAWFVRDNSDSTLQLDDIASRLWKGIEANEEIKVTKHKMNLANSTEIPATLRAKTYKQGNAGATRKTTAPLLKNILESPE
ncbi:hypothetical protein B0H12DRAFT_1203065 [Mycena haematopus]|nr:hypothetical protein B0H12DRAFT_1203065 [Mycena haematopus]